MVYIRKHIPITMQDLEDYSRLQFETGLLYERLHRAWDAVMEGRRLPKDRPHKLPDPPPLKMPRGIDWLTKEKVRKLRAKANDPAVTKEEALAFAAKADELIQKALIR